MAAIIKTKATIAKRALTSFMLYGALNKGFWFAIVIKYINAIKPYYFIFVRGIKIFFYIKFGKKSHKKWLF